MNGPFIARESMLATTSYASKASKLSRNIAPIAKHVPPEP